MAECCCVMYPVNTPETLVRDAIDIGNRDFFNKNVSENKQEIIASVKINNKYSILEYTIMRNQTELLYDLLDETKWGLTKLKQNSEHLTKVITRVCTNANQKGNVLDIEKVRTNLHMLQAKGLETEQYEYIFDTDTDTDTDAKSKSRCNIL